MLLFNIVSGKPQLACTLHNRQKPSGESLWSLHPRGKRSLSPLHKSPVSLNRFHDEKEAVSCNNSPKHGIVTARHGSLNSWVCQENRGLNVERPLHAWVICLDALSLLMRLSVRQLQEAQVARTRCTERITTPWDWQWNHLTALDVCTPTLCLSPVTHVQESRFQINTS